ncbi:MAG: glycoside hydrolase family 32 protein [Bryobacteraceae bacterium]
MVIDRRTFLASSALWVTHTARTSARTKALGNATEVPDQELLQKIANDPLRPQFHLSPEAGFVGDPCAPRFFKGENHVFFHGSFGGRGWSHARSADLIHWQHMPKALTPTEGSYDSYGTFTGSVLPGGDGASVIYTGVTKVPREQETIRNEGLREVQCIATSIDPDLGTWRKRDKPIIEAPPAKVVGFRDPFSWRDEDTWYAGIGSGFEHKGGVVLLYRSKDTRNWEYLHPLAEGTWNGQLVSNPVGSGEMWECPDFFPLGNKHVLIYSTEHHVYWHVGVFDQRELRFHSERAGLLDHGAYYAPKSMLDGKNRRILWGWVQETRSQNDSKGAGWAGAISLPRVLTVSSSNELQMEVPPEFASQRIQSVTIESPRSSQQLDTALSKAPIRNRAGEVICTFKPDQSRGCGLEFRLRSAGAVPIFSMTNGGANGTSSVSIGDQTLLLSADQEGFSTAHIWIDGSVIETFIDKKQVITMRSYAGPNQLDDIDVVWSGPADAMKSLTISSIKRISNDRLTT